jgi:4-amino-4-deoxy-L-arabinose transferase-like glycosyltransferase
MNSRLVSYTLLSLILLLGLHLRLEVVRHTNLENPIMQDSAEYTAYAYNLRLHGTYSRDPRTITSPIAEPAPDGLRAPGYPVFLSFFTSLNSLKLFRDRVIYMQVALSLVTLLMVYIVSCMIFKPAIALLVTLACSVSPHVINMNLYVLTEALFTSLLVITTWFLIKSKQKSSLILLTIGACLLAITALVRPTMQFYFLLEIILLWKFIRTPARRSAVTVFVLAFLSIVSIWWMRNWFAIGSMSDSTLMANTLHHGMYPGFMYDNRPETFGYPYRFDPQSRVISGSVFEALSAIWHGFMSNTAMMLKWYLSKPLYLFHWSIIQGNDEIFIYKAWSSPYFQDNGIFPISKYLMMLSHPLAVWAAFTGVLLAFMPLSKKFFTHEQLIAIKTCALIYLYFIIIHIVVAPYPRYSIPIRPFTYMLALFAVVTTVLAIIHRVQSKAYSRV